MRKSLLFFIFCVLLISSAACVGFAQPGPKTSQVFFTSNAPNAKIFVDDKLVGNAPTNARLLGGPHKVRATAEGYEESTQEIVVKGTLTVNIELKKLHREFDVKITADARGAKAYIDGKFTGDVPLTVKLLQGDHNLKVTAPGYEDFEKSFALDRDTSIFADLHRLVRTFRVDVTADVRGAKVYIDNKFIGDAPQTEKLEEGEHSFKVTAAGYEDYAKTIDVNRDLSIRADLRRLVRTYNVGVTADVRGARVYIDDKFVGPAPHATKLDEGEHSFKVTAAGFEDYAETVKVDRDMTIRADLRPILRDFNVSVRANVKDAKVFIDDKYEDDTPALIKVAEGTHSLKITMEGYEDYAQTINVKSDLRITAELKKLKRFYTLTIQANVDRAMVFINDRPQEGTTPMDLKLEEGRYSVKVMRRGYLPFAATVDLTKDTRIDARLAGQKAKIIIEAPERLGRGGLRLEVTLDGRRMTGTEFEVDRGRHTLRVEAGGMVAEQVVDCQDGRTYRFKLVLDLQSPRDEERDDEHDRGRGPGR